LGAANKAAGEDSPGMLGVRSRRLLQDEENRSVHVVATIVLTLNGADLSSEAAQVAKADMAALWTV
jgi:hypothetical protein